jgi:hypothetical protein
MTGRKSVFSIMPQSSAVVVVMIEPEKSPYIGCLPFLKKETRNQELVIGSQSRMKSLNWLRWNRSSAC